MDLNYILIFVSVLSLCFAIVLLFLYFSIQKKVKKMEEFFDTVLKGKKVKDMEGLIKEIASKTDKLDQDIEDLFAASNQINKISRKGLGRVGVVKYNPFNEKSGRKDCFSIAITNYNNDGIILSSLATESGTKIFLKEIIKGDSELPLTDEEKQALEVTSS